MSIISKPAMAASTDNFTINAFDADYYLGKDNEGRSTLKTVEKITAVFPSYNQNHGLERVLPKQYDGHSVSLSVVSITDETGSNLSYSDTNSDNANLVLRIGDPDTYVHGQQTYIITYTQRDVTRFFSDTNDDEFYWDVNGTEWTQPMNMVSARMHVTPSLTTQLNGKASCYWGIEGSTNQCALVSSPAGGEKVFSAQVAQLSSHENVTVVIGFAPHTFTGYQQTWQEKLFALLVTVWIVLLALSSVMAIGVIIWMNIRWYRVMHRAKGRPSIVAEYLPPKEASVLLSAQVLGNKTADMTAQLIDLAVRHYLKIYQTKDKAIFKAAEYELELVKPVDDLRAEERQLLKNLFGGNLAVGSRFKMSTLRSNYAISKKLLGSRKTLQADARSTYGMFESVEKDAKRFKVIGVVAIILGVVIVSPLVIIAAILAFVFANTLWPLTEKGAELRDYIYGLREYISVAETDRIKMLQSPEGAEKIGVKVDGEDPKELVKLYERVLPYAVLFGIEKEWTKQLGAYYEAGAMRPDWYVGNGVFNAVIFSSALNSFSSQVSSYSSSSSSTSGGSGGGGFSGGGGGGGGGGGW